MKWPWIWLLLSPSIAAQPRVAPDSQALLARIVATVRENVLKLPNYTCGVTIERYERTSRSKTEELVDRVRLEVATDGEKELYAWPGSTRFEERPIHDLVPNGSISTGEFGLFPRTIFLAGVAQLRYAGMESLNGRKVHHFLYSVPRARSHYTIRFPEVQGEVGFAGSTWHDAQTLDLVRLELDIREIPKKLPLSAGWVVIDYARVRVGSGTFLLPQSVDNAFTMHGLKDRNHTTYTNCREYGTESNISYDKFPSSTQAPVAKPAPVAVPSGVEIESKLETKLDSATLAAGDPFEAVVTKSIRRKGEVLVPEGAKIHGHVVRIARTESPYACVGVELHPESIEFEGRQGRFEAQQVPSSTNEYLQHSTRACHLRPDPGSAMLQVYSKRFRIAAGYPILWQTLNPAVEHRP